MSLTTAAICRTKFNYKCYNNTPVQTINAQFLQSSNVHAKVTSLLQYTHLLIMDQDRVENTWEPIDYGKLINQFPPDIIKSIQKLEKINTKICRQKMSLLFNQICINEEMLLKYTHTHTHTHLYIYIYIYIYVYVV